MDGNIATVDMYDADSVLLSDYEVILSGLNTLMLVAFTCLRKQELIAVQCYSPNKTCTVVLPSSLNGEYIERC